MHSFAVDKPTVIYVLDTTFNMHFLFFLMECAGIGDLVIGSKVSSTCDDSHTIGFEEV